MRGWCTASLNPYYAGHAGQVLKTVCAAYCHGCVVRIIAVRGDPLDGSIEPRKIASWFAPRSQISSVQTFQIIGNVMPSITPSHYKRLLSLSLGVFVSSLPDARFLVSFTK